MNGKESRFNPYLVAVYGTLKKGHGNNYLLKDCKFIEESKTKEKFTMYSHGGFPSIAKGGANDTDISVEVYEVPTKAISDNLDMLEGYPGWYDKELTSVNGRDVHIYTMQSSNQSNRPVIKSGVWGINNR